MIGCVSDDLDRVPPCLRGADIGGSALLKSSAGIMEQIRIPGETPSSRHQVEGNPAGQIAFAAPSQAGGNYPADILLEWRESHGFQTLAER